MNNKHDFFRKLCDKMQKIVTPSICRNLEGDRSKGAHRRRFHYSLRIAARWVGRAESRKLSTEWTRFLIAFSPDSIRPIFSSWCILYSINRLHTRRAFLCLSSIQLLRKYRRSSNVLVSSMGNQSGAQGQVRTGLPDCPRAFICFSSFHCMQDSLKILKISRNSHRTSPMSSRTLSR